MTKAEMVERLWPVETDKYKQTGSHRLVCVWIQSLRPWPLDLKNNTLLPFDWWTNSVTKYTNFIQISSQSDENWRFIWPSPLTFSLQKQQASVTQYARLFKFWVQMKSNCVRAHSTHGHVMLIVNQFLFQAASRLNVWSWNVFWTFHP